MSKYEIVVRDRFYHVFRVELDNNGASFQIRLGIWSYVEGACEAIRKEEQRLLDVMRPV